MDKQPAGLINASDHRHLRHTGKSLTSSKFEESDAVSLFPVAKGRLFAQN